MFRRSLILFGAIALLGLAATILYALLGGGGPHRAIENAQARFRNGEYLRVIADLDLDERSYSLQRDPPKFRELLRLRYRSHMALENWPAALRDLSRLIGLTAEPAETLRLDRILLLGRTGDGDRALALAREFIGEQPEHPRALELAGEASQVTYQDELKAILEKLELDLGPVGRDEARAALLAYLYRPEADTEIAAARRTLQKLYSQASQLVAEWRPLEQRLENLRTKVQEALDYFRQSLEVGGEPVAAFHGLALALLEAERIDDLLLLCECYRLRFDHGYVPGAGELAAWALAKRGLPQAAIATAERWVPPGTAEARFLAGRLGPRGISVTELYTAAVYSAWELRDERALQRFRPDLRALAQQRVPIWLASNLQGAFSNLLRGRRQPAEDAFERAVRALLRPPPHGQVDLLAVVMPLRLDNLAELGASPVTVGAILDEWVAARPSAIEPLVALAEHQMQTGKLSGAMATVGRAQRLSVNDEDLLRLRQRVAAQLYSDTDQDGPGLLNQCHRRRVLEPEVPDPVCFLLCGETALTVSALPVALACGRAAVDALPWSTAGRMLEARAELQLGNADTAARLMRELLDVHEPTAAMIELALAAHRAADEPPGDILWRAVALADPSPDLTADLFAAVRDDAAIIGLELAQTVLARSEEAASAPLPLPVLARAAAAFARAGEPAAANDLIARVDGADPELADAVRSDLARAIAALLLASARAGNDDQQLAGRALEWTRRYGLTTPAAVPPLLELAQELEETHPATAYSIVTSALAAAAPEQRTGASFALAGDLALRLGYRALAESHWTAALAFVDGRVAAEPLARFCFATDRSERALQVYALATQKTDPALALRCGDLQAVERLVAERFALDATDLLANITVAVVGLPSQATDLTLENAADRESVLELASILRAPELAPLMLQRAAEFAATHPTPTAQLLLARAQRLAGKPAAAAQLHDDILAAGPPPPETFWSEIAQACCQPGYEPTPAVGAAFSAAAANGAFKNATRSFVVATMRVADFVESSGHPDLALGYRSQAWQLYRADFGLPARWRPTVDDSSKLLAAGRPLDAWWVLDRVRPTITDDVARTQLVQRMIAIATTLLLPETPESRSERDTVYAAVKNLIERDGAYGPAVHCLLAFAPRHPKLAPDAAATTAMLRGHLELVAAGRDTPELIQSTLARFVLDDGYPHALTVLEGILGRHPLALPIWQARAEVLAATRRGGEGIADLRRALLHMTDPAARLAQLTLAAQEFALTAADVAALGALPPAVAESEAGRYVTGLLALRTGEPDRAVELLEGVTVGGDYRLLTLAEALLQSSREDHVDRGREVLEQLARDYPSSSAARYAGSFARQLAPR